MTLRHRSLEDSELFSLMLDTARDKVKNHDPAGAKYSSDAIRQKIFKDILGLESPRDRRFASRAGAKSLEIFQYIVETIDEVYSDPFMNNPFYQKFVDFISVPFGDKPLFRVDDQQYFTVSRLAGGTWDTRRQKAFGAREIIIDTEWYNCHVYSEFWDFLTGRIDWLLLVTKITESINKHLQARIHAGFMNSPNILPSDFVVNGTGVITDEMVDLCEKVRTATGYAPIIAGTKQGLRKLTGDIHDAWVSGNMADTQNSMGVLSMWNGYELFVIPNSFTQGTYKFEDMDKLFVMPSNVGKFIKVVNEGGQIIRATDLPGGNQDWTLDYNVSFKQGVAIVMGTVYGLYNYS